MTGNSPGCFSLLWTWTCCSAFELEIDFSPFAGEPLADYDSGSVYYSSSRDTDGQKSLPDSSAYVNFLLRIFVLIVVKYSLLLLGMGNCVEGLGGRKEIKRKTGKAGKGFLR